MNSFSIQNFHIVRTKILPCTIEIERSGPPDGDKSKNILVKTHGFLNWSTNEWDVVQRLEMHRIFHTFLHFPRKSTAINEKINCNLKDDFKRLLTFSVSTRFWVMCFSDRDEKILIRWEWKRENRKAFELVTAVHQVNRRWCSLYIGNERSFICATCRVPVQRVRLLWPLPRRFHVADSEFELYSPTTPSTCTYVSIFLVWNMILNFCLLVNMPFGN